MAAEAGLEPATSGLTGRRSYQLCYSATSSSSFATRSSAARPHRWQGGQESNPQPVVLETTALPVELPPYVRLHRSGPTDFSRRFHTSHGLAALSHQHDGVRGAVVVCYFTLLSVPRRQCRPPKPLWARDAGNKKAPGLSPRGFCDRLCVGSERAIHRSHRASGYMEPITI